MSNTEIATQQRGAIVGCAVPFGKHRLSVLSDIDPR
jgi:hypothetical protein